MNKGKEGTHGIFKTKKAADAQRKAMFANGYTTEDLEDMVENLESHEDLVECGNCYSLVEKKDATKVGKRYICKDCFAKDALKESETEDVSEMDFDAKMDFLVADEQEAIDGYDQVIDQVDDEHIKDQLNKIRTEEEAHKDYLDQVKEDPTIDYVEPLDQEDEEDIEIEEDWDDVNWDDTYKALEDSETKCAKIGDKIRINHLKGEDSRYDGREGVVDHIDDIGQLWGTWGGLAVIPEEDDFDIIADECLTEGLCTFKVVLNKKDDTKEFSSEEEAIKFAKDNLSDEPHVFKKCEDKEPIEIASYKDWTYGVREGLVEAVDDLKADADISNTDYSKKDLKGNADMYRTILANYQSDDYDINVEFGILSSFDEYDVVDQKFLLAPNQTKGDLLVYLSYKCGFNYVYLHDEETVSSIPDDAKSFETVPIPNGMAYEDFGDIDEATTDGNLFESKNKAIEETEQELGEDYTGNPEERTDHLDYVDDNPTDGKFKFPKNITKKEDDHCNANPVVNCDLTDKPLKECLKNNVYLNEGLGSANRTDYEKLERLAGEGYTFVKVGAHGRKRNQTIDEALVNHSDKTEYVVDPVNGKVYYRNKK